MRRFSNWSRSRCRSDGPVETAWPRSISLRMTRLVVAPGARAPRRARIFGSHFVRNGSGNRRSSRIASAGLHPFGRRGHRKKKLAGAKYRGADLFPTLFRIVGCGEAHDVVDAALHREQRVHYVERGTCRSAGVVKESPRAVPSCGLRRYRDHTVPRARRASGACQRCRRR
jgi:hypothetical protein